MEVEEEPNNIINLIIQGKSQPFSLLKGIQNKLVDFLKNIAGGIKKTRFNELKAMVKEIDTNSELNYNFLKVLKEENRSYNENKQKWNYQTKLKLLKETLTDEHYKLLENKAHENPLKEFQEILKAYILNYNDNNNSKLIPFNKKYKDFDARLNFPLITAIERKRIEYYKTLIFETDITEYCDSFDYYFENMDKDTDITNYSLDDIKFCPKTYLLILTLTEGFTKNIPDIVSTFYTKNIIKESLDDLRYIKNIEGKLYAFNKFEKIEINPEYYILRGLNNDIENHQGFPLKILLLRNESFKKFTIDGGKGFLKSLELYDDFISYLKDFIKSKCFKEIIQNIDDYKNIEILINNEQFINELLDDTHFRFLPFYRIDNYFGFTNKDIMITFINSIPEIAKNIKISKENEIENVTNICLLFTIAVKFITAINEFIIHLTYGYLNYVTKKKIGVDSKKESIDENNGFFFWKKK